ncbi:MAG: DUF4398 domain-containing protein [Deltaproteobacteria bacterium]|jgi:hypothetical protein|nr:MAG: DUF4398 domain-containing protein [Deltaproteobacteria bacterium]TNF30174.1 MAG: DUF4398 domain-containing protein [Deltaproteobacteria bacterium]
MTLKNFFLISLFVILAACGLATTRPKLEMSLAQSAFLAARQSKAQTLAPGLYRKAEFYYLKAKSSYKRKYFNKAKQYAILSKNFSERAEFVAIRKATLENL